MGPSDIWKLSRLFVRFSWVLYGPFHPLLNWFVLVSISYPQSTTTYLCFMPAMVLGLVICNLPEQTSRGWLDPGSKWLRVLPLQGVSPVELGPVVDRRELQQVQAMQPVCRASSLFVFPSVGADLQTKGTYVGKMGAAIHSASLLLVICFKD